MKKKPWWQSKTVWFNVFAGALGIADNLAGLGVGGPWFAPAIGALNIGLRALTTKPLGSE